MLEIAWHTLNIGEGARTAVDRVIRSGYVNEGKEAARFAAAVAARLGMSHGQATTSGTAAIALSLWALGVQPGQEVIVPDLTFVGTASAARLVGAKVVCADVDATSLTMDPAEVERLLSPSTAAVVVVHLNGRAANLDAIRALLAPRKIPLVEDAAQALGSRGPGGQPLGGLGDASCLSFAPTKILTTGQGGMVLTKSEELALRVRAFKDQGRSVAYSDAHPHLGFNFRMSDVLGAIGASEFERLDARVENVLNNSRIYREGLGKLPGIELVDEDTAGGQVPAYHGIYLDARDALIAYLKERKIASRALWSPVSSLPAYGGRPTCPRALRASQRGVWLPGGPDLPAEHARHVVEMVQSFVRSS